MQSVSAGWTVQQGAGAERAPVAEVTADWHRTGSPETVRVGEVTVRRQVSLGLPTEVTLISGTATASATVEIVGDPTDGAKGDPVSRHSPYRTDSDLHLADPERVPVDVSLGFRVAGTPEVLAQITGGLASELETAEPDATVQLEVLDGMQAFHAPVDIPLVIGADPSDFTFQPGLRSSWIVERIFEAFGFHTVPAPRDEAVLAATLHGSAWPQVGDLVSARRLTSDDTAMPAVLVPYAPGRFGLAMGVAAAGDLADTVYTPTGDPDPVAGGALFVECWATRPPTGRTTQIGGLAGVNRQWNLIIDDDGSLTLDVLNDAGTLSGVSGGDTVPDDGGLHYVGIYAEFVETGYTAQFRVDDSTTTDSAVVTVDTDAVTGWTVGVQTGGLVEAVQVTTAAQATVDWGDDFAPTATIEAGLAELDAVPSTHADDAFDMLGQIASAEGALVFVDELGVPTFWTRDHFTTATASTTVQADLVAANITGVRIQQQAYRVRNVIQVPAQPLFVGAVKELWKSARDIVVPPLGTVTWEVSLGGDQAYAVSTDTHVIPSGGALVDGRSGYRAAHHADGSGGQIDNLVMTVIPTAAKVVVSVQNRNAFEAHLVSPSGEGFPAGSDGNPAVVIVGRRISTTAPSLDDSTATVQNTSMTATFRHESSIGVYGEVVLAIDENPWRQHLGDAAAFAASIAARTGWPLPQFGSVRVRARPELQIGDRVTLTDGSGRTGLNTEPCLVMGMVPAAGPTRAFEQDLTLIPVGRPGGWILGLVGRSELGVTTRV